MRDFYRIELDSLDGFDATVARFDRTGEMTWLNGAGERLLGVPRHAQITLRTLFQDETEYARVIDEQSRRLDGRASAYAITFSPPGRPGTRIPVTVYAFPDTDDSGDVLGSIVLVRDLRDDVARDRIHHAIETTSANEPLLEELAAALRDMIPFDVLRVTAVSTGREHVRRLFTTDADAPARHPFRWWPMPALVRRALTRHDPYLRTIEELRDEYADLIRTEPEVRRYMMESGVRQTLTYPILRDNRVVAFFSLDASRPDAFDGSTIDLLRRLPVANAVSAALHREDAARREAVFGLLRTLAAMAGNVQGVCDTMVERLRDDFGWHRVGLYKLQDGDDRLQRVAHAERSEGPPMAESLCTPDPRVPLCAQRHEGVAQRLANVTDLSGEDAAWARPLRDAGMRSMIAVSMPARTVRWLLTVESQLRDAFATEEIDALEVLTAEAASLLCHASMFERQRAVLSAIEDAVLETHESGRVRWANRAAARLLGVDRAAVDAGLDIATLMDDAVAREAALLKGGIERLETRMRTLRGGTLPVLLSAAPLPAPLGGRVFVASDFSVQKELIRLNDLKEVFKHAAMEGRVPLALAASSLMGASTGGILPPADTQRLMRLLARADLPLERLMRMFADETHEAASGWCDLHLAVRTTLTDLPGELASQVHPHIPDVPLSVNALFDDVQFCVESMVSFALRTKPQASTVRVATDRCDDEARLRVLGDWTVLAEAAPEPADPCQRWKRKTMSDLALGQGVIERLARRVGGSATCAFEPHLALELRLPLHT